MGVRLMVEALDHAPDGLSSLERLLLIALAEKTDDATREVRWSRRDNPRQVLRSRLNVTDSGLSKVLARLASRGLDPRVQVSTEAGPVWDSRGRPVYSHEGHAVEYRLPPFTCTRHAECSPQRETTEEECSPQQATTSLPFGRPLTPEWSPERASLSPSVPRESLDARETTIDVPAEHSDAVAGLLARHGSRLDYDDAAACVAWTAQRRKPDNLAGYVGRFSLEDVLAKAQLHRTPTTRGRATSSNRCVHGRPNGADVLGVGANRSRRCGQCEAAHPAADDAAAQDRAAS